jgi:hypothetical protein
MTDIPDTQLEAWGDLLLTIGSKRQVVLNIIDNKPNGATLFQIADILDWPINRVSGRVTELKDMGKIIDSGERLVNPNSGKKAIVWKTK